MPVLAIDKPLGITSHDAVAVARRALGTRRVGHAGTLDPLATGVLVLLTQGATKLSPFLTGSDKAYLAWVAFGAGTPTLDAEGPVEAVADPSGLDAAAVAAALPPFLDLTEQRPPAFSAVQEGGVRSYRRAREGRAEEPAARPAGYHELELLALAPTADALPGAFAPDASGAWLPDPGGRRFDRPPPLAPLPTALLRVRVRAGTYVRALARDLGRALGLPAHLAGLVRTSAGRLDLARTVPLDALAAAVPVAPADALGFPTVELSEEQAARVRQGQRPALERDGRTALLAPDGSLVAIAEVVAGRTSLLRVWPSGDPA